MLSPLPSFSTEKPFPCANTPINQVIRVADAPAEKGQLKCLNRSVRDLDRTQAFYRSLFDLKVEDVSDSQLTLSDGFTKLHFNLLSDMREATGSQAANAMALIQPHIETRNNHLAFGGRPFADIEPQLVEQAIPYETFAVPGTNMFQTFFFDPDGHLLEITEAPLKMQVESDYGWGVQHVSHLSNTLQEDCVYLESVLGFSPMPRPNFDANGAWYTDGFIEYHLVEPSLRSLDFFSDQWEVNVKVASVKPDNAAVDRGSS